MQQKCSDCCHKEHEQKLVFTEISQIVTGRRLLITPRYIWTLLRADQTTSMVIMRREQTSVLLWLPIFH